MASKVTKAIQHRLTKKPSKNGVSFASTAKLSSALKSTSLNQKPLNSYQYGRSIEDQALSFFRRQKLQVLLRNKKIWGVEHDYVVQNAEAEIYFVEVKSLSSSDRLEGRVKPRQIRRLLRSAEAFIAQYSRKSRGVWLLAIERSGKTHFLPLG